MRLFVSTLAVTAMLGSHIAVASDCARTTERPAFDVEELKSELMVTAISCKEQSKYNAFIGRYKSDIASHEKLLTGYFSRSYGRAGQKQHDEYITNLANVQSQQGEKSGTGFCDERTPMFNEVMALESPQQLPAYAEGKNLATPVALTTCTTEPKATSSGRRSRHVVHHITPKTKK